MKKEFSTAWKSSKQPRKQRKYLANAPLHIRKKFVSINLSKELRKKHAKRNMSVRKGDVVQIMRGKFKGKKGKVTEVKLKISKVTIEGIQAKKQDGSKVNIRMQPSNLQIIELNLEDRKRNKVLERKIKITKSKDKPEEKNALKKTKSS
jgi:large subunit ribosomal protein L24